MAGVVGMLLWLATVTEGSLLHAFLLAVNLSIGAFFVLNGPIWIATRGTFRRGPEAPPQLQAVITWLSRLLGAGVVMSVFYLLVYIEPPSFG